MTKAALRKLYRVKRGELPPHEREKMNDLILVNFQKIPLPFIECIHSYIASQKLGEPDTLKIIRYLQFKNPSLKVLVPKIDIATASMAHLNFDEQTQWAPNAFGIAEPTNGTSVDVSIVDLVLVPLLAFDQKGSRVGFGKGYYDRFLALCPEKTIKIGISFFPPIEEITDINRFDIPLDMAVTPQQVFTF